jgi:hypothetical protein
MTSALHPNLLLKRVHKKLNQNSGSCSHWCVSGCFPTRARITEQHFENTCFCELPSSRGGKCLPSKNRQPLTQCLEIRVKLKGHQRHALCHTRGHNLKQSATSKPLGTRKEAGTYPTGQIFVFALGAGKKLSMRPTISFSLSPTSRSALAWLAHPGNVIPLMLPPPRALPALLITPPFWHTQP